MDVPGGSGCGACVGDHDRDYCDHYNKDYLTPPHPLQTEPFSPTLVTPSSALPRSRMGGGSALSSRRSTAGGGVGGRWAGASPSPNPGFQRFGDWSLLFEVSFDVFCSALSFAADTMEGEGGGAVMDMSINTGCGRRDELHVTCKTCRIIFSSLLGDEADDDALDLM